MRPYLSYQCACNHSEHSKSKSCVVMGENSHFLHKNVRLYFHYLVLSTRRKLTVWEREIKRETQGVRCMLTRLHHTAVERSDPLHRNETFWEQETAVLTHTPTLPQLLNTPTVLQCADNTHSYSAFQLHTAKHMIQDPHANVDNIALLCLKHHRFTYSLL